MKYPVFTFTMLSCAVLLNLSGCQQQPEPKSADANQSPAASPLALKQLAISGTFSAQATVAGQALQLRTDANTLQVLDAAGKVLASAAGRFERLTLLQPQADQLLISAVDKETQKLWLWQYQAGTLTPRFNYTLTSRVAEDLCFYQSAANQQLSLFVIGDRGGADQLLLQQQQQWLPQPLPMRVLNLPYDAKSCAVDSHTAVLYVSEPQGLWRFNAEAESDEAGTLMQARQPFGAIQSEISAMQLLPDGQLLALEAEPARLLRLTPAADDSFSATAYSLPNELALQSMAMQYNKSAVTLQFAAEPAFLLDVRPLLTTTLPMQLLSQKTTTATEFPQLQATLETVSTATRGDVIDDPAFWHHATNPANSRILATDKRSGLEVYNLQGERVQQLPVGRLNNVDVRYGLRWQGKPHDIAVASLRNNNSLQLFAIDTEGLLHDAGQVPTELADIYGMCLYQPNAGEIYAFVNDKSGRIDQFRFSSNGTQWQGQLVRSLKVPSQPEGCVADDKNQRLYVGEEDVGVWTFAADATAAVTGQLVISANEAQGPLVADVEGMALLPAGTFSVQPQPLLLISSQGNDSYVLYQATPPYAFVQRFRVGTNPQLGIDGSSETDGLDLTVQSLGPAFPFGAMAIQDGRNRMPEAGQNLKLVPLQQLEAVLKR
ncbi:phytase [Rheinheimera texasensis]|uniref:phytase n=1 Tax=Rheinheimera texasensis TaxID=306205 RepID=UPI0032B2B778